MMWIAYGIFVAATISVLVYTRRKHVDDVSPTTYEAPVKIERNDFPESKADTLIVVFTSKACDSCANVREKANVVKSDLVDVEVVEYEDPRGKNLHAKYDIEAVPTLVISNANGVVEHSYVGPVTATDLWADVARVRGATIDGCSNH